MKKMIKKAAFFSLAGLMALTPSTVMANSAKDAANDFIGESTGDFVGETPTDLLGGSTGDFAGAFNDDFNLGAWSVYENEATNLPDEVQKAFEQATSSLAGVKYTPVALLATQIVSGMNYKILCTGTSEESNTEPHLYILTIYAAIGKDAEISYIDYVDLLSLSSDSSGTTDTSDASDTTDSFDTSDTSGSSDDSANELPDDRKDESNLGITEEEAALWDEITASYTQAEDLCAANVDIWIKLYGEASAEMVYSEYNEEDFIAEASNLTDEEKQTLYDQLASEISIYSQINILMDQYYEITGTDKPKTDEQPLWDRLNIIRNREYAVTSKYNDICYMINFVIDTETDGSYYGGQGAAEVVEAIKNTSRLTEAEKDIALKVFNTNSIFDTQSSLITDQLYEEG